jgi:hypothetical protein
MVSAGMALACFSFPFAPLPCNPEGGDEDAPFSNFTSIFRAPACEKIKKNSVARK